MNEKKPLRVLGIDPGLAKMGWGVIEVDGPGFSLIEYGSLSTSTDLCHSERLLAVHLEVKRVVTEFQPDVAAIEEIFCGKNPRTALVTGEARAASILACSLAGLRVVELAATVVKLGVTGNGHASKEQVQAMVQRILKLAEPPRPADAADALAVAIVQAQRNRRRITVSPSGTGGS
ncbi:MAG: crossover junction endodeoxyribonuclease RuvC [Planctomycetota bacterium]|nr:crossover junction endodeoxyribonuclease RuvC [Planctomycetota bacterium]MEE2883278.1 crossover junction endodeoxyribonuclease RuvC [Planctomycetota bacterium]